MTLSERIAAKRRCLVPGCTREPRPDYGMCDPDIEEWTLTHRIPTTPARQAPQWVQRMRRGELRAKELER